MPRIKSKFMNLTSSTTFTTTSLLCATVLLMIMSTALADVNLSRRDEAYQPAISHDFPHLLGSKRVLGWMDSSVDPCNDFFQYSCGGFQKRYDSYKKTDVLELMQQANSILMEQIMSQNFDLLSNNTHDTTIYTKTKKYFDSCLNTRKIADRGIQPILPYAQQIISDASNKDFIDMLISLNLNGVWPVFRFRFGKVEGHDPADLRLMMFPSRAYPVDANIIKNVLQYFISNIPQLPSFLQQMQTDMDGISNWIASVEKQAAVWGRAANSAYATSMDNPNGYISIEELTRRTGGVDWKRYVSGIGMAGVEGIYLWAETSNFVDTLASFAHLPSSTSTSSSSSPPSTPPKMVFYYIWRLAMSHFNKLSKEYYDVWQGINSNSAVRSSFEEEDEFDKFQQDCVEEMGLHLPYLSGHLYVKYALNDTQKEAATELVNSLYSAFKGRLAHLTWMDEPTRAAAIKKLDSMANVIGYPDWLKDAKQVDDYYQDIDFDASQYFENAVKADAFASLAPARHQLGRPLERETLYSGFPWMLNAFHLTDYVIIQINSGILQRPLFSNKNRDSMNFGSLGMVIGHELTHAFDSIGYKLNEKGEAKPWWSSISTQRFDQSAQCFKDEYSTFSAPFKDPAKRAAAPNGGAINGERTLSENIADNGGLNIAYEAWVSFENDLNGELRKTVLQDYNGLTDEQVFFVSFAQTWCSVQEDDQMSFVLDADVHSPNAVRVNGAIINSPYFSKAFQCKPGSKMNVPDSQKCSIY